MKLSYWLPPDDNRKCRSCDKKLARRARRSSLGYCRVCRLKCVPPATGKKRPDMIGNKIGIKYGENNPSWRGDHVSYSMLHAWVKRQLGKPDKCFYCGDGGRLHWASISHKAKRDLDDYFSLCPQCHYHYDRDGVTL